MKAEILLTRQYRDRLLDDPYRSTYHFAIPDDCGMPGDPNGAFFADGVYHLMYLYKNSETDCFNWGHVSSIDLVHWRHHHDAITAIDGSRGCYSGGAFVDDDKTAYISYWQLPTKENSGGIYLAYSYPPYDDWTLMNEPAVESSSRWYRGITDIEVDGKTVHIASADPSNIWKADGKYYMLTGNKPVIDQFGRAEDAECEYTGDWTDLFSSVDLKTWEWRGRFYNNDKRGVDGWPDKTEDNMCPSFLPLFDAKENGKHSGKYLLLFISHNKGCQYYIGSMDGERFIPEMHGRMAWADTEYFAPEALIDDKNRHISWSWLRDNGFDKFKKFGWSGEFSLPRVLWLEDGELKMSPVSELDNLQYAHSAYTPECGDTVPVLDGELCRIKGVWSGKEKCGLAVRVNDTSDERVEIYYSPEEGALVMDTTKCTGNAPKVLEKAPFSLRDGEDLSLDVFIDKAVIEVFANDRQAISRRVYPNDPKSCLGVRLIGEKPEKLDTYKMFPANPY